MEITKAQLKQIIKEELEKISEGPQPADASAGRDTTKVELLKQLRDIKNKLAEIIDDRELNRYLGAAAYRLEVLALGR
tara:strand:- start:6608 stop:6841 length:234 start_codon:yes stop_codon:yes gene_type:complete